MSSIVQTEAEVLEKTYLEDQAVELLLQLNKKLDFEPGQFIMIEDKVQDKLVKRAYSIASPPSLMHKKLQLKLCIKKKEGGLYSTFVYAMLKKGHKMRIQGPFGEFKLSKAPTKRYYFIAAGSGIAPFLSMIPHLLETKDFESITLIYGNRYESDILYHTYWQNLAKTIKNFRYVPVLSREAKKGYLTGHVQDHINDFIDKKGSYFVCGMPQLVEDVKSLLKDKVAFIEGEGY